MWLEFLFGKHGSHHSLSVPPSDVPRGLTDGRSLGAEVGSTHWALCWVPLTALLLFVGLVYSQLSTSEGNRLAGRVRSSVSRGLIVFQCPVAESSASLEADAKVLFRCHYHFYRTL